MEFGIPSCVQSEKGENIMICHFMVPFRGPGRGSHIAGFSVHNQRIERLWRDVCWCVCCLFHEILYFLSVQRKKWSPRKIWVNRMIDPARRNLTAVADVVNGTLAPDDLGINCEGPLPDKQTHTVDVPETFCPLSNSSMQFFLDSLPETVNIDEAVAVYMQV